jgi:hypothetical protein
LINFNSFADELVKIAEENQHMNTEKVKRLLGNTALIAGGTAVGYGLSEGVRHGLKKFKGSPNSKVRQVAAIGLPLLGGAAVLGYKKQLDSEKNRLLEEAYQKGAAKGQRDW